MKTCTKCKISKPDSEFYKNKQSKDGLYSSCKTCKNVLTKSYGKTPKMVEYHKEYNAAYAKTPKGKLSSKKKAKKYCSSEKGKKVIALREKLPKRRKYCDNLEAERLKIDPVFKLKKRLRVRLNHAIGGLQKVGSAVRDLGCTGLECKIYLESLFYPHPFTGEEMSWWNYGDKWQIDHIIEFNSIDVTDREQLLKVLHYSNLQPLWTEDHKKKSLKRLDKTKD